jgi:hypothetical protein
MLRDFNTFSRSINPQVTTSQVSSIDFGAPQGRGRGFVNSFIPGGRGRGSVNNSRYGNFL